MRSSAMQAWFVFRLQRGGERTHSRKTCRSMSWLRSRSSTQEGRVSPPLPLSDRF